MILAILQARVSSTRLPGKVLKPILDKPMMLRQIERIKRATLIDYLIIATSTDITDNPIERLCKENDLPFFRGSLKDVLDRFYQASMIYHPDHIIRLTGDCPLADPELIDTIVAFHRKNNFDYTSNTIEQTYPDGLDVEVFRFSCLCDAWKEAVLPSQREHVTPFIYQHPERFRIGSFKNTIDLSALRWTVDESLDFELVTKIYETLYPGKPDFSTKDILGFLEGHQELKTYNTHYIRNAGYQKSLREDALVLEKRENN
ncbi:MAG: glycosyltransferase family protein [Candidatus Brocadiaceae bacterium]